MSGQPLIIPRLQDESILECAKEIKIHFTDKRLECRIQGQSYISYTETFPDGGYSEISQDILNQNSTLISSLTITIYDNSNHYFRISIDRGGNTAPKSPVFDSVIFKTDNINGLDDKDKLWLITTISEHLKPFDPARQVSGVPTTEQKTLEAIHEQTLDRLEKLNEKLIRETQQFRKELNIEFEERRQELEEKITEKEKKLENKYESKHQELQQEKDTFYEDLQKQKDALEAKKKEIDDRSNTHARREIRKDILDEIKKRTESFQLTKDTRRLRLPIASAMVLLIIFLVVGAWFSAVEFINAMNTKDTSLLYSLGIRQLLFTFGAVASLIYFIRWLNRWFEQHAQAEFQLKQFQLDVERASWIVETTLEWNDAKGTTIPDKLLESLSRNLFKDTTQPPEQVAHPADQLASALIGTASSIKLKAGDSEISVDPKKLKKAGQSGKNP